MMLTTSVALCNGVVLNPDNAHQAPILDAATRAVTGAPIHVQMQRVLQGAHVRTYETLTGLAETVVLTVRA